MENSGYMGACTSGVRVARILCGRDVRPRTEAGALPHSDGLVWAAAIASAVPRQPR
jgi:hypothetical protein